MGRVFMIRAKKGVTMAGLLDHLGGEKNIVQHQLDIVSEQIQEIRDNPEYSDIITGMKEELRTLMNEFALPDTPDGR